MLEWTPALTIVDATGSDSTNATIPHGFIFAAYMVAMMIGSNLFKVLSSMQEVEEFMRPVLALASLCLAVPILLPKSQILIFIAFIVFEVCVGIFWPSMGTMRGRYVPENARSTIMNFFRIPLNFIVVMLLLQDIRLSLIWQFCVVFLLLATVSQYSLNRLKSSKPTNVSTIQTQKLLAAEQEVQSDV